MLRPFLLSTLALLALDGASVLLAPTTGLSFTGEAQAADFTGRIKRVRIKKRRTGSGFKIASKLIDDGDASVAQVGTLEVTVCDSDGSCADAVELEQDRYSGLFKTRGIAFDGAEKPEGSFELLTNLRDADGALIGLSQSWNLLAVDGEITLTAADDVTSSPYISELTMTSDACGNGTAKAHVDGDDADLVASVEWVDVDGLLLSADDVELCADGACATGSLATGRSTLTHTKADLGALGTALEAAESDVTVDIAAYDNAGDLLGTVTTNATNKYGDILIDGVPLEFDLVGSSDPIDLYSVSGDSSSTTTSVSILDLGTTTDTTRTLSVTLEDASTSKEVLSTFDDTPARIQQSFAYTDLVFDPGEAPDDYGYLVLIDLLDDAGDPVGDQYEVDLVMPSFDGETVGTDYAALDDGTGAVGFLQGEDGIVAHFVYQGDLEVSSANLIFEEPYEGPAPLETEVTMEQVATWTVYEQSTSTALPEAWTLTVSVTDGDGTELDAFSTSGTGEQSAQTKEPPKSTLASNLTVKGNLDVQGTLK